MNRLKKDLALYQHSQKLQPVYRKLQANGHFDYILTGGTLKKMFFWHKACTAMASTFSKAYKLLRKRESENVVKKRNLH